MNACNGFVREGKTIACQRETCDRNGKFAQDGNCGGFVGKAVSLDSRPLLVLRVELVPV